MNIFKKLLRTELGENRYNGLANFVDANLGPEVRESKELYDEIYNYCRQMDTKKILEMQMRLNEVLFQSFHTGKTYMAVFFIYLCSWFVSLTMDLHTVVLLGAIGGITLCFGVMSYRFFASRCAYVDARIIEVYRNVLERLLSSHARG